MHLKVSFRLGSLLLLLLRAAVVIQMLDAPVAPESRVSDTAIRVRTGTGDCNVTLQILVKLMSETKLLNN